MTDGGLKEETKDAVDAVFITDDIAKEELRLIEQREEQTKANDNVRQCLFALNIKRNCGLISLIFRNRWPLFSQRSSLKT